MRATSTHAAESTVDYTPEPDTRQERRNSDYAVMRMILSDGTVIIGSGRTYPVGIR